MVAALWIIAVCEVIRIVQNTIQLGISFLSHKGTENVQKKFIENLVQTDKTFAKNFMNELEEYLASETNEK